MCMVMEQLFVAPCPVMGTAGTPTGSWVRNSQWGDNERKACGVFSDKRKLFSES